MNKKLSVYVVDDSTEQIHMLKESFSKSEAYQVIGSATNGEQCLFELHGKKVDILILDLIMPKKDGIAVLKELKSHNIEATHIIATTPFINELIVSQIQGFKVDYILMKPFEIKDLIQKLNYIVGFISKDKATSALEVNLDEGNALS